MRPLRLRYTAQAREHIAGIHEYIKERNSIAATQVVARIRSAAERLAEFPRIGHVGRVEGTHEWVVRGLPYIIVYEIGVVDPTRFWYSACFTALKIVIANEDHRRPRTRNTDLQRVRSQRARQPSE